MFVLLIWRNPKAKSPEDESRRVFSSLVECVEFKVTFPEAKLMERKKRMGKKNLEIAMDESEDDLKFGVCLENNAETF